MDSADLEDTSTKVSKMEHMLAGIPIAGQIHAPTNQFRTASNTAENLVMSDSVAVTSDSKENMENVIEPVAPML